MPAESRTGRVAVVGAGIAGLAAARTLVERGREVVVFDKGRGPGGRATSRRAAPFAFDHGAQYLTARDPGFRRVVAAWEAAGAAARWDGRIVSLEDGRVRPTAGPTERFVGTPSMSSIARYLARDLDVRSSVRVGALARRDGRWELRDAADASLGRFEDVVLTAPPAQAAALLAAAPNGADQGGIAAGSGAVSTLAARAAALVVRPCWAVLLGFAKRYDVPFDGAFCVDGTLAWIARDNSKPGRPGAESWVLHATPDWSEDHLDDDPESVVAQLARAFERATRAPLPPVAHRDAHRWAFALPDPAHESSSGAGCLVDRANGLVLAGDALSGGRIEGAYLSGVAAGAAV